MARSSYPQQGLFPADGADCGPYTANEWRAWMLTAMRAGGMVNTGAAAPPGLPATPLYPNVGVFYVCPNRLLVEESPANTIRIGTGAWLCDGTFGYNDTQITGVVPAVGPRTDYVIVRQNYSAVDFTTGPAGATLTVEANTADITIINSANFTQDQNRTTYWDIPLASYDIDGAGVITNLTDLREWVDAETKECLIQFNAGWDGTVVASLNPPAINPGFIMPANSDVYLNAHWRVPQDYISGFTATPVITYSGAPPLNVRVYFFVGAGACAEHIRTHTSNSGWQTVGIQSSANQYINCLTALTQNTAGVAVDDIVWFMLRRDGTDVADDASTTLGVGVLVEYLGWGRK